MSPHAHKEKNEMVSSCSACDQNRKIQTLSLQGFSPLRKQIVVDRYFTQYFRMYRANFEMLNDTTEQILHLAMRLIMAQHMLFALLRKSINILISNVFLLSGINMPMAP